MRPRTAAADTYDRLSDWYGLLADPFEREYRQAAVDALTLEPGETVLDVGTGTGAALPGIAGRVGPSGRVYGLDLSAGMCEAARRNAREAGVADRTGVVRGDALHLPFPEDSVDAVLLSFTLELFDTPYIPDVLAEVRRVLGPDGRLAVVSLAKTPSPGVTERAYEWTHRRWPALVDCRPIYVREHLTEAGFAVEKTGRATSWGLPVDVVVAVPG
ncbi:class I SAM-dependent methyltransferase [Halobacteriaceae archaeon GCM10025711]